MMKGVAIFFGLFFFLVALLFWAKMAPAGAHPFPITVPQISKNPSQT